MWCFKRTNQGEFNHWKRNSTMKILVIWSRYHSPPQSVICNTELLLKQSTLNQTNYKDTRVTPRKHFHLCWQPKMLSIFSKTVLMPWEKMLMLKWKKQDTVSYMQYDLNYEIILIFIHWKKDWKKMHQTFNCSYLCIVG